MKREESDTNNTSINSSPSVSEQEFEVEGTVLDGEMECMVLQDRRELEEEVWKPELNQNHCQDVVKDYLQMHYSPDFEFWMKTTADGMGTIGLGASCSEGYGTEELLTEPETTHTCLPGESDADADVEDAESRLQETQPLQRVSSKRRRRPRIVKQDTTESEDDGGRNQRTHRWNLRLSPHHGPNKPIIEESISQMRPLVLGKSTAISERDSPSPKRCKTATSHSLFHTFTWSLAISFFILPVTVVFLIYVLPLASG
ncbi:uncharacterized protein si:ch211-63p21.1 [Erpetoichthys calabaricus]|uniref:uncharacterized protein si:ch211-63p21.1 n=1 Tax=Erpetoichthys calabaricus TaxID=27687 RepID=UPI00109F9E57|nr:uncharacterized protein si:ch211-63p21.1 [Erpetoichthys calabaricus]